MKFIDLAGQRFGKLVVIGRVPNVMPRRFACTCDCGKACESTAGHLRSGNITSCGCKKYESQYDGVQKDPNIITKVRPIGYDTWVGIKQRCHNPRNPRYKDYGARGIIVCDRWRGEDGFKNFLEDMGPRPGPKYSLDREKVDGNYCKDNCRWATDLEQGQNTRRNKNITWKGRTMCITAWERELGFNFGIIHSRLKMGWSVEKSFLTPPQVE